jgi:hypothetical protein
VTYSFTDQDGNHLHVSPGAGAAAVGVMDRNGEAHINVKAAALPDLVASLYEAAGLKAPFLLSPDEVGDGWVHVTGTRGAA